MKIGELSTAASTPVETIRFYEREGLLPPPARTISNYRSYEDTHLRRLVFITRCRSLDMSLDEIRALLQFRDAPEAHCSEVNAVLDAHIGHVAMRLRELHALETELHDLRTRCGTGTPGTQCGILEALDDSAITTSKRPATHGAHPHLGALHTAGRPGSA